MSSLLFERSSDDRLIAGVCGGIAARLAVDATLVRLVFAILALAGGAGILVYLALWIYARGRRALPAAILFAVASAAIRREAQEETGFPVLDPVPVFQAYMSPGSVTERLHFFAAPYQIEDRTGAGGGYVIDARVGLGTVDVVRAG